MPRPMTPVTASRYDSCAPSGPMQQKAHAVGTPLNTAVCMTARRAHTQKRTRPLQREACTPPPPSLAPVHHLDACKGQRSALCSSHADGLGSPVATVNAFNQSGAALPHSCTASGSSTGPMLQCSKDPKPLAAALQAARQIPRACKGKTQPMAARAPYRALGCHFPRQGTSIFTTWGVCTSPIQTPIKTHGPCSSCDVLGILQLTTPT
ncbi:uncharacterized protein K460DRAFT_349989 [Cucurbitaria berberidis CBS 394.84]|uniref:Uncharacterized protein n=1 Tax=Cucurbitaria berberidis CBS 394.84 TaxID=1168544 RepID=A0A9P4LBQ2_9PLEO|nr:uncharacterized protein K460DRAFT_349989 [Cucurbitaria berberidis CBS 394.84]KAF1849846.1 hypothetical protein K460DRAFT_349989 [Cucurbitaria berberidis CBS 394.84]